MPLRTSHPQRLTEIARLIDPFGFTAGQRTGREHRIYAQGRAAVLLPIDTHGKSARAVFRVSRSAFVLAHRNILLASGPLDELEQIATEATALDLTVAGIRLGPGGRAKMTVLLVDGDHRPAVLAKLPLTSLAATSIATEAQTLTRLTAYPALAPQLPSLVGEFALAERKGILLSAGSGTPRRSLGGQEISFLALLHSLTAHPRLPSVNGAVASWRKKLDRLPDIESDLCSKSMLEKTIDRVAAELGTDPLPHSTAHGDFTSWNVWNRPTGGLFVMDWEASVDHALPCHDLFHYEAARTALSRSPWPRPYSPSRLRQHLHQIWPDGDTLLAVLHLAHMVETILWYSLAREGSPTMRPGPFWTFLWKQLDKANKRF